MAEEPRSKRDRIERLRSRLREEENYVTDNKRVVAVIKGILDLLSDEL